MAESKNVFKDEHSKRNKLLEVLSDPKNHEHVKERNVARICQLAQCTKEYYYKSLHNDSFIYEMLMRMRREYLPGTMIAYLEDIVENPDQKKFETLLKLEGKLQEPKYQMIINQSKQEINVSDCDIRTLLEEVKKLPDDTIEAEFEEIK